jgi:DNA mismatch repair ATPase MutS
MNKEVVGNDIDADGDSLIIVTGANQGGKSTFLRSVGLAQVMTQCGMFVPASALSLNI